jgi:two-component system cell cycle sensor histidine kinase/response regulator CckA
MLDPARIPKPGSEVSCKPGSKAEAAKAEGARVGSRPSRETILLVDDEASVRKFLSRILAKEGYQVLEARDGEDALARSEAFKGAIHLLVTDVMMPVMNGKDLADRLCVMRPDIKVLFISGYSRADIWPDVCEDVTEWLPKPFTATQFHRKVRKVLGGTTNEP